MSNHLEAGTRRTLRVRADALLAACPSRVLLARLGEKWSLLAIAALSVEPLHFGELRRRVQGVSQKMLTQTLRALERDGLVRRSVVSARPLRVEYSLTVMGAEFARHALALKQWIESHLQPMKKRQSLFDRRQRNVDALGP
jgi:DNA-binding HxlR family transcriptional regulator